jgi:hypothetical protein
MVSDVALIPPSGLPAISPTGGEISWWRALCLKLASLQDAVRPPFRLKLEASHCLLLISPLVGEMPGRAEGGNAILLNTKGGISC